MIRRRILFVDRKVQGWLALHVVIYWTFCLAAVFLMMASYPAYLSLLLRFGDTPTIQELVARTWSLYWPAMVASFMLLPAVIWDLMRVSKRFVGPIYRIGKSMGELAAGKDVPPVKLRKGDFWSDLAAKFNQVSQQLQDLRQAERERHAESNSTTDHEPDLLSV